MKAGQKQIYIHDNCIKILVAEPRNSSLFSNKSVLTQNDIKEINSTQRTAPRSQNKTARMFECVVNIDCEKEQENYSGTNANFCYLYWNFVWKWDRRVTWHIYWLLKTHDSSWLCILHVGTANSEPWSSKNLWHVRQKVTLCLISNLIRHTGAVIALPSSQRIEFVWNLKPFENKYIHCVCTRCLTFMRKKITVECQSSQ